MIPEDGTLERMKAAVEEAVLPRPGEWYNIGRPGQGRSSTGMKTLLFCVSFAVVLFVAMFIVYIVRRK